MGALVAMLVAGRNPNMVSNLVLISPGGFAPTLKEFAFSSVLILVYIACLSSCSTKLSKYLKAQPYCKRSEILFSSRCFCCQNSSCQFTI
jgi:pimeloyl-ACP methyl ester carboxylesterase